MKKLHVLALALVAVFAFGAIAVSSASAIEWLAGGNKIVTAEASETEGEITLEDNKVPFVGKAIILCSGILDGLVGPGAAGTIEKVLTLAGAEVSELAGGKPITNCTNVSNCAKPEVYAEKLPWKSTLVGTVASPLVKLEGSAYDSVCETIIGLVEDLCENPTTKPTEIAIVNAATDVETPAGTVASPNANCTQGGTEAGVNTAETTALIHLVSGLSLQVS